MCGIVGYIGERKIMPILISGLHRLEYRGYDSAGVALINEEGNLFLKKTDGRISDLEKLIYGYDVDAVVGLGHTRWATHGIPSDYNAHPHTDCKNNIVIVHNGIIENYQELKTKLIQKGHKFTSDTDTEVVVHLIEEYYERDLEFAVKAALNEVEGSYAIGVIACDQPDKIVCARAGSPLIIGIADNEHFIASDIPAVLNYTKKVIFLDDYEVAVLTKDTVEITTFKNTPVYKKIVRIKWDATMAEKSGYSHFMLKEINEQSRVVLDTLAGRVDEKTLKVNLDTELKLTDEEIRNIGTIHFVACGTAYHACMLAKYVIENLAGIQCTFDVASEFRYRNPVLHKNDIVFAISQSGETADTLAAIRLAKERNFKSMAMVNVIGSTATREADHILFTRAGPEIGVAATKTFISQLTLIYALAIYLGQITRYQKEAVLKRYVEELLKLPQNVGAALNIADEIKQMTEEYKETRNFLYIARGYNYPIALEGALKLKEISYIHAEGYGAGEMKHGPIALIDKDTPTLAIAVNSPYFPKMMSNILEIKARSGPVICVTNESSVKMVEQVDDILIVPFIDELLSPILTVIPLQLFAYYVAVKRGCNVDKPRNLAKSVTVE